jgi:AcrR family transcriptional regulator
MTRGYDMTHRARAAAGTTERIVDSTEELLASTQVADVTLHAIAAGANVSVQTVLRHMGSREGCFEAVGNRLRARIDDQRGRSQPGEVDDALDALCIHYEAEGRLVLNLLAQETSDPLAHQAVAEGRALHRAWVERCFGPLLPTTGRDRAVDALVAATDLYVWRLLRLDLGRSASDTRATIGHLVRALLSEGDTR